MYSLWKCSKRLPNNTKRLLHKSRFLCTSKGLRSTETSQVFAYYYLEHFRLYNKTKNVAKNNAKNSHR